MNRPLEKHVLDLAEAARFLGLPRPKVRALAEAGKLPGRKAGRQWRFSKSALDDWQRTQALLQQAGLFKNSEIFPEVVEAIRKARQRSENGGSAS